MPSKLPSFARRTSNPLLSLALLAAAFAPESVQAKLLQIIHTSDLHGHLEHSAKDPTRGGYAQIKAKIEEIRAHAQAQGIETLLVDAGDFSEGSPFYLAKQGTALWEIMSAMGYEAVTLGNHDWLMGPRDLDRILARSNPSFKVLGANFFAPQSLQASRATIQPYLEVNKGGLKIAILGVTTSEIFYKWRAKIDRSQIDFQADGSDAEESLKNLSDAARARALESGTITNPRKEAAEQLPELLERNDAVIALSHLGYDADLKFAAKVPVDLILGGHSHTLLKEGPANVRSPKGDRDIPIVHTGEHGQHVGNILVDIDPEKKKPLQVIRYSLDEVSVSGPQDPVIAEKVSQVRADFESEYGKDWLTEVLGEAKKPLVRQTEFYQPSVWSQFAADAMREAAGAELALDSAEFTERFQPAGPVTREKLLQLYPRYFDLSDRLGWTVWKSKIRGSLFRLLLVQSAKAGQIITASGVTYRLEKKDGRLKVRDLRVGGKKFRGSKLYTIALPEGFARGALGVSPAIGAILKQTINTGKPILTAFEEKLRRDGGEIPKRR